jgi:hypothetical protein
MAKRKISGKPCPECGEIVDTYYVDYCPKCDIQKIIKHKRGSFCLIPIINYGEKYIKGFTSDVFGDIFEGSNDTYFEYTPRTGSKSGKLMIKVLEELGIGGEGTELLYWVSW